MNNNKKKQNFFIFFSLVLIFLFFYTDLIHMSYVPYWKNSFESWPFKTYSNFINQGGPVVFILFLISIYLFILIFAKFKFLFLDIDTLKSEYKKNLLTINKDQYYLLNISLKVSK